MSGYIRTRKYKNGTTTYQVVIEKGVDSSGKRQRDYFAFQTKKEAQRALAEKVNELNHNTYVEPSKLTISQALDDWYTAAVAPSHKENTKRGYLVNIGHIKKHIGHIPLQKLTAAQIQTFYTQLEQEALSPRSIQYIHTNLKSALKYYFKMQMIPRNPADFVTPPKQRKAKNDYHTEEEAKKLLQCTQDSDIYLEIVLALGMGLRRGEVLALTWSDIDFKTSTMRISKSLSRVGSEDFVSTTKTISGERVLKIPEFVVKALKDRRHTQWKQRIILQETYHDNDLVCCRQDGSYYVCGSFTSKFSDLLQKKGMRHIRFHDLRHTNATLLMQYHVPIKVVSQSLGHASTNVTVLIPNSNTNQFAVLTEKMSERVFYLTWQDTRFLLIRHLNLSSK